MKQTQHYKLNLPSYGDSADIEKINENTIKIDEVIKSEKEEAVSQIKEYSLDTFERRIDKKSGFNLEKSDEINNNSSLKIATSRAVKDLNDKLYKKINEENLKTKNELTAASDATYEKIINKKSGFNLEKSHDINDYSSEKVATTRAVKVLNDKLTMDLSEESEKIKSELKTFSNSTYEKRISKKSGFNLDKSDEIASSSTIKIATSNAVKKVNDKVEDSNFRVNEVIKKTEEMNMKLIDIDNDIKKLDKESVTLNKAFLQMEHCKNGSLEIKKIKGKTASNLIKKTDIYRNEASNRWATTAKKIKPSTVYTVKNDGGNPMHISFLSDESWLRSISIGSNSTMTFTTQSNESRFDLAFIDEYGWTSHKECLDANVMILEGNFLGKEIKYFEGIKGAELKNIRVTNRNLWNLTDKIPNIICEDGVFKGKQHGLGIIGEINVKRNTEYVIRGVSKTDGNVDLVININSTKNESILSYAFQAKKADLIESKSEKIFNTGENDKLSIWSWAGNGAGTFWIKNIEVIEKGKEQESYIGHSSVKEELKFEDKYIELNGINGKNDEIVRNMYIKRINKRVLKEENIIGITTHYTNLDYVKIQKPANHIAVGEYMVLVDEIDGCHTQYAGTIDDSKNEWFLSSSYSINEIWVGVPKGRYTLETAKTFFTGKKHIYTLKEEEYSREEITDYSYIIPCYEDGYIELDYENIMPEIEIAYPQNFLASQNTTAKLAGANSEGINSLWLSVIPLADKELKMSNIELLEEDSNSKIKEKLNEIISKWKGDEK